MMEEAIEHSGDGRTVSQQFAPVLHRSVGGEQSTGALIASHHDLQQFLGGSDGQLALGPPGTGKSHLAQAIGQAAIEQGCRVRYRETHKPFSLAGFQVTIIGLIWVTPEGVLGLAEKVLAGIDSDSQSMTFAKFFTSE